MSRSASLGFYLDSGWPGDNYEVTMAMATALITRGWRYGHDLMHFCFPHAAHNENAWGIRLHLPMQFINGAVAACLAHFEPGSCTIFHEGGSPTV